MSTTGPLRDSRIVDLTNGYGAFASRLFAELGADVVRVETAVGGRDRLPLNSGGTSLHHWHRNCGKTIFRREELDDEQLEGLFAGAHLVFSSGGGSQQSHLLEQLNVRHPHLIIVSITPFGLQSSHSEWNATELVAQSMAGVVYRSGVSNLPPVSAPGSLCEDVGAVTAALAAMIALRDATESGIGQIIDLSTVLSLAQCTDMSIALWSMLQFDQVRQGASAYPLFQCTDGLARIVLPMSPREWRALIVWLGSPAEWTGPEWEVPMLGPEQRAMVIAKLPERFASATREDLEREGTQVGVRITSVLTPNEVLTNEHTTARKTFIPSDLPFGVGGKVFAGMFGVDGQRATIVPQLNESSALPSWAAILKDAPREKSHGAPLAGLRVVELGSGVAAPDATKILAEWGADVIKIEHRDRPDFQRMVMGGEMNPAFATPNRSKRVFGANLTTDEGKQLVLDLLCEADVLIENNATGVLDRLGLGWDVLSAMNPDLVLVDSQLYGDQGPWAQRKGYGPSARAAGGLTWLWAHSPDSERGVMSIHPDHLAGRLCAFIALAGLHRRDQLGKGGRFDVAQFEAVSGLLGDLLLFESVEPGSTVPTGNTNPDHGPWGIFQCADDDHGSESWIALTVEDDNQWAALVSMVGDELENRPEWATESDRVRNRLAIENVVGRWLSTQSAPLMEAKLQAQGVTAGQVLHPRLQVAHPFFVARGFPVALEQKGFGQIIVEGPAFTGQRLGNPRCDSAPLLGEHTEEICRELLGLNSQEIRALHGVGAIDGIVE